MAVRAASTNPTDPAASPTNPGSQPASPSASDLPEGSTGATPSSDEASTTAGPDFIREAFNRLRGTTIPVETGAEATVFGTGPETEPPTNGTTGSAAPEKTGSAASSDTAAGNTVPAEDAGVIRLTQQELDRRVQAETDRRVEKQRRDDAARQRKEHMDTLRKTDPWKYAQVVEEDEAAAKAAETTQETAERQSRQHMDVLDRAILDPFFAGIPEDKKPDIFKDIEPGMPGRTKLVEKALTVFAAHHRSEGVKSAREELAKDPAFIKEILTRHGGQRFEPENIQSSGEPNATPTSGGQINDQLRGMWHGLRR